MNEAAKNLRVVANDADRSARRATAAGRLDLAELFAARSALYERCAQAAERCGMHDEVRP